MERDPRYSYETASKGGGKTVPELVVVGWDDSDFIICIASDYAIVHHAALPLIRITVSRTYDIREGTEFIQDSLSDA